MNRACGTCRHWRTTENGIHLDEGMNECWAVKDREPPCDDDVLVQGMAYACACSCCDGGHLVTRRDFFCALWNPRDDGTPVARALGNLEQDSMVVKDCVVVDCDHGLKIGGLRR